MKCLNCGGPLEYAQQAQYARCTHCLSLFQNGRGGLTPIVVSAPGGGNDPNFNAAYAQQLGFAPRQASHAVFSAGGVGVKVNTAKIERDLKNKVEQKIWGLIIGAIIVVVMLGVLAGVGGYVWWQMRAQAASATGAGAAGKPGKKTAWDGKTPFTCAAMDNVTLEGVTANIPAGTAITAQAMCQLTLVNVNVTAPIAIDASGNSKVTITGGSIKGTTSSIVASANAQVAVNGATVTGPTKTSANAKVTGVK